MDCEKCETVHCSENILGNLNISPLALSWKSPILRHKQLQPRWNLKLLQMPGPMIMKQQKDLGEVQGRDTHAMSPLFC